MIWIKQGYLEELRDKYPVHLFKTAKAQIGHHHSKKVTMLIPWAVILDCFAHSCVQSSEQYVAW